MTDFAAPIYAVSVTLTTHGVVYSLAKLMEAIDSLAPLSGREINIQVDDAVAGTVAFGDGLISATRRGYKLANLESRTYRSDVRDVPIGMLSMIPSADGMVVNVEVCQ